MRKGLVRRLIIAAAMIATSTGLFGFKPVSGDGNPKDWDIDKEQFVYDYADVFSEDEELKLQELCDNTGNKLGFDFVVVTTRDLGNKNYIDYADDFYDEGCFGYEGDYGSGVLYLIDLDEGNIYISTSDLAILYINDNNIESILDEVYEQAHSKYYYKSAKVFVDEVYDIVSEKKKDSDFKKLEQEWFDGKFEEYVDFEEAFSSEIKSANETSIFTSFRNPIVSGLIALVIALISVLIMSISSKTKMTADSRTYLKSGSLKLLQKYDRFTHRTTTSHKAESSSGGGGSRSGSSHHSSSGGHSHGGGGRKL